MRTVACCVFVVAGVIMTACSSSRFVCSLPSCGCDHGDWGSILMDENVKESPDATITDDVEDGRVPDPRLTDPWFDEIGVASDLDQNGDPFEEPADDPGTDLETVIDGDRDTSPGEADPDVRPDTSEMPEIKIKTCAQVHDPDHPNRPALCSSPGYGELPLPDVLKARHPVTLSSSVSVEPWVPFCSHPLIMRILLDGRVVREWTLQNDSLKYYANCTTYSTCPSQCRYVPKSHPPLRLDPDQMDYGPHEYRVEVWMPAFDAVTGSSVTVWFTKCALECTGWSVQFRESLDIPGLDVADGHATLQSYVEDDGRITLAARVINAGGDQEAIGVLSGNNSEPLMAWKIKGLVHLEHPLGTEDWAPIDRRPFLYVPKTSVLAALTAKGFVGADPPYDGANWFRLVFWTLGETPGERVVEIENPSCQYPAIALASDPSGVIHFLNGSCLDPENGEPVLLDHAMGLDGSELAIRQYPVDPALHSWMRRPFEEARFDPDGVLHLIGPWLEYLNTWVPPLRNLLAMSDAGDRQLVLYRHRVAIHSISTLAMEEVHRYTMDIGGFDLTIEPSTDVYLQSAASGLIQEMAGFCYPPCVELDAKRDVCGREWLLARWHRHVFLSSNRQGMFHSELLEIFQDHLSGSDTMTMAVDPDQNVLVAYPDPSKRKITVTRLTCSRAIWNEL